MSSALGGSVAIASPLHPGGSPRSSLVNPGVGPLVNPGVGPLVLDFRPSSVRSNSLVRSPRWLTDCTRAREVKPARVRVFSKVTSWSKSSNIAAVTTDRRSGNGCSIPDIIMVSSPPGT